MDEELLIMDFISLTQVRPRPNEIALCSLNNLVSIKAN